MRTMVLWDMLKDGEVGWYEAQRALSLRQAAEMKEVVQVLADAGLAHVVKVERAGRGRPTRVIRAGANHANSANNARGART